MKKLSADYKKKLKALLNIKEYEVITTVQQESGLSVSITSCDKERSAFNIVMHNMSTLVHFESEISYERALELLTEQLLSDM